MNYQCKFFLLFLTYLLLPCVNSFGAFSKLFTSQSLHIYKNILYDNFQTSNTLRSSFALYANPVTSEGSNYRGDITEEEAFLWFDEALVYVRAGSGGAGSNAVQFGKARQHMNPTGGSGGDGGSIIFKVDPSFNTLLGFRGKSNYRAENGKDGDCEYMNGLKGLDTVVTVPKGTVIKMNDTDIAIGELTEQGQELVVAKGGLGGRGNAALGRSKGVEKSGSTPAQGGERRWLKLELKLVADIGLVGVPNAGKSTLLDAITNAKPKIASYPFTTIVPNLGVCEVGKVSDGGDAMVIADIPGLLEGASQGVGLGKGFLRHIERCKIIIHVIDGNSADPVQDYLAINNELTLFSKTLAMKPQIVVLNKLDLLHDTYRDDSDLSGSGSDDDNSSSDDNITKKSSAVAIRGEGGDEVDDDGSNKLKSRQEEIMEGLRKVMSHSRLLCISAAGRVGTSELVEKTHKFLSKIKKDEEREKHRLEMLEKQEKNNDNDEVLDVDVDKIRRRGNRD